MAQKKKKSKTQEPHWLTKKEEKELRKSKETMYFFCDKTGTSRFGPFFSQTKCLKAAIKYAEEVEKEEKENS